MIGKFALIFKLTTQMVLMNANLVCTDSRNIYNTKKKYISTSSVLLPIEECVDVSLFITTDSVSSVFGVKLCSSSSGIGNSGVVLIFWS